VGERPASDHTQPAATALTNAICAAIVDELAYGAPTQFSRGLASALKPVVLNAIERVLAEDAEPDAVGPIYIRDIVPDPFATPGGLAGPPLPPEVSGVAVECGLCGRPLVQTFSGKWTHQSADGGTNVGCRAASYTQETGWNDLPRHWRATPSSQVL
jgi:hypothetical protein